MAKGFKINGVDFDDIFEPVRSGFDSVTFTGLSPTCSYMKRTGNASNPNAAERSFIFLSLSYVLQASKM